VDRSFFSDLTTERLLLRNIALADADFFYQVYSNPLVCQYLFDEEPIQSIGEAIKWINIYNSDDIYHNRWIIIGKKTGIRLGTCGFHNWDYRNRRVEIGYNLLPEFWGKGYMIEA
jgi:ribosomal-protein-alanine N-acetyltransferase